MTNEQLIEEAIEARKKAYAPYSGYMVGAALLTKDGQIFHGCNIESASYSPTNCAERTAFFNAISQGERDFSAIAVIGAHRDSQVDEYGLFYPCGVCRQVMMEFCDPKSFIVIVAKSSKEFETYTLLELLPNGFGPSNIDL